MSLCFNANLSGYGGSGKLRLLHSYAASVTAAIWGPYKIDKCKKNLLNRSEMYVDQILILLRKAHPKVPTRPTTKHISLQIKLIFKKRRTNQLQSHIVGVHLESHMHSMILQKAMKERKVITYD